MCRWDFTPYNLDKWNKAEERILFVGVEPNGENPHSGKDMGRWFRTATPKNKYHTNPQFYTRCVIMLIGINNKFGFVNQPVDQNTVLNYVKNNPSIFGNFRFMDLKATQGGGQADKNIVSKYVEENIEEVAKYFNSTDRSFGLTPHIIVLLGNTTQLVFIKHIKKRLINDENLKWVGMPHPSAQVGYEGLIEASKSIQQHLKPINQQAEKWVYDKNNFNNWKTI